MLGMQSRKGAPQIWHTDSARDVESISRPIQVTR